MTLQMKIRTQRSHIQICMGLKLIWSVNLFFWFKRIRMNINIWENLNINFFHNFFQLKTFLINCLFNIRFKSLRIIFIKIIFILLILWNRFLNYFLLNHNIICIQIMNWVMWMKLLTNILLKLRRLSSQWKQYLRTQNLALK